MRVVVVFGVAAVVVCAAVGAVSGGVLVVMCVLVVRGMPFMAAWSTCAAWCSCAPCSACP
ncbi:hypothetical protein OG216_11990 [Streptomycetaceae bacterium NBC_01309]